MNLVSLPVYEGEFIDSRIMPHIHHFLDKWPEILAIYTDYQHIRDDFVVCDFHLGVLENKFGRVVQKDMNLLNDSSIHPDLAQDYLRLCGYLGQDRLGAQSIMGVLPWNNAVIPKQLRPDKKMFRHFQMRHFSMLTLEYPPSFFNVNFSKNNLSQSLQDCPEIITMIGSIIIEEASTQHEKMALIKKNADITDIAQSIMNYAFGGIDININPVSLLSPRVMFE